MLRGVDNGYAEQPHVRYWLDGASRFASTTAFPPVDGEVRRPHLGSGGADHVTHRLSAEPTAAGSHSWAAVPYGVPVLPGLDDRPRRPWASSCP